METETKKEQKGLYLNPVTDFGFKYIFRDADIMMPFIEDVLNVKISQLTYLNTEVLGQTPEEKKVIYDLLCQDSNGNEFLVEMQNGEQVFFSDRIVYYMSKRISSEIKKGEDEDWQYGLTPVYGIFILNFNLDGMQPSAVRTIRLKVEETGETFNSSVTAYTLELPGYRTRSETEQYTNTETWIYNIANLEKMKGDIPFADRQPAFKKLQEKAKRGNLSPEEDVEYESCLKAHRDYNAVMDFKFQKGKAEGRAEGKAEGKAEGIEEGFAIVAKRAKSQGKSVEEIAELTGLTPEQIATL